MHHYIPLYKNTSIFLFHLYFANFNNDGNHSFATNLLDEHFQCWSIQQYIIPRFHFLFYLNFKLTFFGLFTVQQYKYLVEFSFEIFLLIGHPVS